MLLSRPGCKPILSPTEKQIGRALTLTKSSFLSLTAPDGSYVQVGGGPGLFLLEHCDSEGTHFRARQETNVVPFPDGTILSFAGSEIAMAQHEWFLLKQVAEVLSAFAVKRPFPAFVQWKKLNENYAPAS